MTIDRVLRDISKGERIIKKGGLIFDGDLPERNREILREKKVLSPISAPPLAAVPGWEDRAERLREYDINTIEDYIEADNNLLRKVFRAPNARVDGWREELINWMIIPSPWG